jgi:heme-degrading monooxygenase HmoA
MKAGSMAIKVLISRHFKEEFLHEASLQNTRLRALATVQPGYISGQTLVSRENSNKVVVISTWSSEKEWANWYASETRKDYYKKMRLALESPETVEIFDVGAGE